MGAVCGIPVVQPPHQITIRLEVPQARSEVPEKPEKVELEVHSDSKEIKPVEPIESYIKRHELQTEQLFHI